MLFSLGDEDGAEEHGLRRELSRGSDRFGIGRIEPISSNRSLPISAFIICKNEASAIRGCVESLRDFQEIVVVDSGSTDATLDILSDLIDEGHPINLMHLDWSGYAAQKQFALEQCRLEWCFSIDADERPDRDLIASIKRLVASKDNAVGWRIARRPYLLGHGYSPAKSKERKNLRLIRRGFGAFDLSKTVHEGIVPKGRVADCSAGSLLHFTPHQINDQIAKEMTYADLKSDMIVASGEGRTPWRMVFNPLLYFLRLYLRNGLWRCGFAGFIQATKGSIYSFLTEANVYQKRKMLTTQTEDREP